MKLEKIAILPFPSRTEDRIEKVKGLALDTQNWLEDRSIDCVTDPDRVGKDFLPDLICVLGGDGAFIRTVRRFIDLEIPFLGVNFGTRGFLLPIEPENFQSFLEELLSGKEPNVEERTALLATIIKKGGRTGPLVCINDVVLKTPYELIQVEVRVDGELRIRPKGDGVIVSTPTGSTAYNFAAGGTPLAWYENSFGITAIACFDPRESRAIVSDDKEITLTLLSRRAAVVPDGILDENEDPRWWLEKDEMVKVKKYEKIFRTLTPADYDPYKELRKKLLI